MSREDDGAVAAGLIVCEVDATDAMELRRRARAAAMWYGLLICGPWWRTGADVKLPKSVLSS
jgi:hypothetical protein